MPNRLALLIVLAATLATATVAEAATWSTGSYRGTATAASGSAPRGTVAVTVTRTRATLTRLSMVLRCTDGERRTFTVDGAGSGRLHPGPAGAGVSIRGRRDISGWDVDWNLVGGVRGSTFRGSVSGSAVRYTGTENDNCSLIGAFRARRR